MIGALKLFWWYARLRHPKVGVRKQACEALGRLGDLRAVAPLLDCLFRDQALGESAAAALQTLADHSVGGQSLRELVRGVRQVQTGDWRQRESGCRLLAGIDDEHVGPVLARCVGDTSRHVREAALSSLVQWSSLRAVALAALTRHRDPVVRAGACEALGQTEVSGGLLPLQRCARNRTPEVRLVAVRALARLRAESAYGTFVRGLRDADWRVRRACCRALAELGDERAVAPLARRLEDTSERVRQAACRALGALGSAAAEPLIETLASPEASVRRTACNALGDLGDAAPVAAVAGRLADEDWTVRREALRALRKLNADSQVERVRRCLADSSYRVRAEACRALTQWGDPSVVEHAERMLIRRQASLRAAACEALGALGNADHVALLVERLSDEVEQVRRAAAEALVARGEKTLGEGFLQVLNGDATAGARLSELAARGELRVVEPLLARLKDATPEVRAAACSALGAVGATQATEALVAALGDNSPAVRAAACRSLAQLDAEAARRVLPDRLEDHSPTVRAAACLALGACPGEGASPALLRGLADETPTVREAAAEGFTLQGEAQFAQAVQATLAGEDTGPQQLSALAQAGDLRATPVLVARLADAREDLRVAACDGLRALGDPAAVEPLLQRLGEPAQSVRAAAFAALSALGEAEAARAVCLALEGQEAGRQALTRLVQGGDIRLLAPLLEAFQAAEPSLSAHAGEALQNLTPHAVEPLVALLAESNFPPARTLLEEVVATASPVVEQFVCRWHFTRFETRQVDTKTSGRLSVLGCRQCGRTVGALTEVDRVIARFEDEWEESFCRVEKDLHVNAARHSALFDFDRVEVIAASDYELENLCVQIGNSPDPTRRLQDCTCLVAPDSGLSRGMMNLLRATFAQVTEQPLESLAVE